MPFNHDDIKDKFKKCKYRQYKHCIAVEQILETPVEIIAFCGNCVANQKEPNIF